MQRLYRKLVAHRMASDVVEGVRVLGLAENADGSGWSLVFQEGDEGEAMPTLRQHCVSDQLGRSSYGAILTWIVDGKWLRLNLAEAAQNDLELPPHVSVDLDAVAGEIETLRQDLTRIVGDEESARLRLVVTDIFHLSSRPWPIAVGRVEAGEVTVGQLITIETPDGRIGRARIAGLELHSRPGQASIAVSDDEESLLREGAVIRDGSRRT
jgi:hypothetical protein